ncbi:MAG: proteasome subunit beta [Nanoarchaeota archaeon]|nr:proteasome subunit beta [Nanoarchaeota archaeon]MBU4451793.1 proteasome subunit beta [Nanoarchaeota archaeon]MCG2723478.1 proteasome subunit beta [archaeon]
MLNSELITDAKNRCSQTGFLRTGFSVKLSGAEGGHENGKLKTGTTTVGLVCKDGIVLATDNKATMGHLIASKTAKKILEVSPKMAVTIAGDVGDAQAVVRLLSAELRLYTLSEKVLTVKAAATLLGNMLRDAYKSWMPEMIQLILGGADDRGVMLYSITADGAVMIEDEYTFSGSGSVIAIGVLEDAYKKDMPVDEGIKLSVRAIKAARERDVFTGGKDINVVTITQKDGVKWVPQDKINLIIKETDKK